MAGQSSPAARQLTLAAVLLTIGTGGTDVLSFTRLGGVFTSVMTGNLVLLGLAAARTSAGLAGRTAISITGYALGVAAAARLVALAPPRRFAMHAMSRRHSSSDFSVPQPSRSLRSTPTASTGLAKS